MNRGLRRQLEAIYREKIDSSARSALSGPPAELKKSEVEQLEAYSKLLTFAEPRWTADAGLAMIVALLCVAVAAFLWSEKVPRTSISLGVETESLQGNLSNDSRVDNLFKSQLIHFERLSKIQAPNLGLSVKESEGDAWFRLEGGQITLQSLDVEKGALLIWLLTAIGIPLRKYEADAWHSDCRRYRNGYRRPKIE